MPSQKYALKKGGPKRLVIRRGTFSQKRTVLLDGKELGVIANQRVLREGWRLTSKNGTILFIKGRRTWGAPYDVRLNDVPLPNSDRDPRRRIRGAYRAIFVVAAFNIWLGLNTIFLPDRNLGIGDLQRVGTIELVIGLAYGLIGVLVWRESLIALGIAIIGYGIDALNYLSALGGLQADSAVIITALFINAIFLMYVVRAINPMWKLWQQKKAEAEPRRQLTKVEMSLLLVVVVLVQGGGALMVVQFVNSKEGRQILNGQAEAQQPLAFDPDALNKEKMNPLPFTTASVQWSTSLDRMIAASTEPNQLHIYDPETGEDVAIDLALAPINLALSPDGHAAVVGHDHKISYVDLAARQVSSVIDVNVLAKTLNITNNSWAYVFGDGKDGDKNVLQGWFVNLLTHETRREENLTIPRPQYNYPGFSTVVSQDSKRLYMFVADMGTVIRFDLDELGHISRPSAQTDNEIPGGGTLYISTDEQYLLAGDAMVMVYKLSPLASDDLIYRARLISGGGYTSTILRSLGQSWIVKVEGDSTIDFWQAKDVSRTVRLPGTQIMPLNKQQLPPELVGDTRFGLMNHSRIMDVFANAAGTRYYMIYKLGIDDYPSPAANGFVARDVPPLA